jgi:hypothetical protein
MKPRSDRKDYARENREGHEFSCRFAAPADFGFSRWGKHSGPQWLKPMSFATFLDTSGTRALPGLALSNSTGDRPYSIAGVRV